MRTMMMCGLLVAASMPLVCLRAQDPAADTFELRADTLELNLSGENNKVITLEAAPDRQGSGRRLRLRLANPEAAVVLASGEGDTDAERAWLGVQLGEVPPVLLAHLRLKKGEGVMVLNIVEGSPADKGGLQRYDVVLAVDGKQVDEGSRAFAKAVSKMEQGRKIKLSVIQNGKRKDVTAALGTVPRSGKHKYKFKSDRVELGQFELRGGVGTHGPDGWIFDWTDKKEIPLLGRLFVEGEKGNAIIVLGDKSVRVETTGDGGTKVVVVKKEKSLDGETTEERVYENVKDLEKDAPEVYQLLGKLKRESPTIQGQVYKELEDWIHAPSRPRVFGRKLLKRWKPDWEELDVSSQENSVDRNFKVEKDGRILVSITRGKSRVETSFENEAEMKEKEPKLHAHYRALLGK